MSGTKHFHRSFQFISFLSVFDIQLYQSLAYRHCMNYSWCFRFIKIKLLGALPSSSPKLFVELLISEAAVLEAGSSEHYALKIRPYGA